MKKNISLGLQRILFATMIFFLLISVGCSGGGEGGGSGGGVSPGDGGIINLGWYPNTESDLAGYRLYYGTSSGAYSNSVDVGMATLSGGLTTYSITNLAKGQTYCVAIAAYDTSNNESGLSNEVCGEAL